MAPIQRLVDGTPTEPRKIYLHDFQNQLVTNTKNLENFFDRFEDSTHLGNIHPAIEERIVKFYNHLKSPDNQKFFGGIALRESDKKLLLQLNSQIESNFTRDSIIPQRTITILILHESYGPIRIAASLPSNFDDPNSYSSDSTENESEQAYNDYVWGLIEATCKDINQQGGKSIMETGIITQLRDNRDVSYGAIGDPTLLA